MNSGDFFPIGPTTVECSVTDSDDNLASAEFTITVSDTELPTVTTPDDITINATSPSGAVATYVVPSASDNAPGVTVSCVPPPGTTFPIGPTEVTCTATDASTNMATTTFTITVIGAGDLLAQLRADTIDAVTNPTAERALLATIDRAIAAQASGNVFDIYTAILSYVVRLDAYESRRMVSPAAAHELVVLARQALDASF
jgi:hypothetical protein